MPTPDDLQGGVPEDDGTLLVPGTPLATSQGETRYQDEAVSGGGRFSMYDKLGEFNPRGGGFSTAGNERIAYAPTTPSGTSGASWASIGALFWDGGDLPGSPTDYVIKYEAWSEPGSADYQLRVVLADVGTVVGTVTLTGGTGQQLATIDVDETLLPSTHDAILIQHRSVGGGSGGLTYSGQLVIQAAP